MSLWRRRKAPTPIEVITEHLRQHEGDRLTLHCDGGIDGWLAMIFTPRPPADRHMGDLARAGARASDPEWALRKVAEQLREAGR